MEIPEHLFVWLQATGLYQLSPDSYEIPIELIQTFEGGQAITKLIKRLNQIKNNLDRLMTPVPEMNTLKQAFTPAAKLYNWNILGQALALFGIHLDPDTKSLIVAGDRDMIVEVLEQIYNAENERTGSSRRDIKPNKVNDSGLVIESISEDKELVDASSCLEYLIISFCRSFEIKPKQSVGLLAQSCKYLAHIVAKGLKGDFEPVRIWLQELYSTVEHLCALISREQKEGSLEFVMTALKPGILSRDFEVVEWTLRVISRLALSLSEYQLIEALYSWFQSNSILELCFISIKRVEKNLYKALLDLLLQIGTTHYSEIFSKQLLKAVPDPKEYIIVVSEFLKYLQEDESAFEEIYESTVVEFWIDYCSQLLEERNYTARASALNFLNLLVGKFFDRLSKNDYLINTVLTIINKTCREEGFVMKMMGVSVLFEFLQVFAQRKSSFAPVVYRTLTFLLVENYNNSEYREFIVNNFIILFKDNSKIPISILLDPLIKRMQVPQTDFDVFDYDFFSVIAQNQNLAVKHAIQLIDIVGKVYINDLLFAKCAGVPFTYLASRFIQQDTMQEYLYMFTRFSINFVLNLEQQKLKKTVKKVNPEQIQQRNRVLDMISWIIQQWQDELNAKIKELVLQTNYTYAIVASTDSKAFLAILGLFGAVDELLEEFKTQNPKLFQQAIEEVKVNDEESRQLALVPSSNSLSKASVTKKRAYFPWARANGDIERAKKKKQDHDLELKQEEEKKSKALLLKKKKIRQQLEFRKLEQGIERSSSTTLVYQEGMAQKLVATTEEIPLREFTNAESDQLEAVNLLLSKYSRVFKVFFNKYSGTGFARKNQHKSDFDFHAERKNRIFDGEYIKIMNDHNVIPVLLIKEELRNVMRTYNHRIAKQADQGYVDYEGFKGVFCQLAYYIYSKKANDYSHLPPVVSIKLLLDYMRNNLSKRNLSTEIFDEPDPGTGDKDVVRSLNKLLLKDPNTPMPEGYKRVLDKDLKICFTVPSALHVPEPYKFSIEIIDSVLSKLGIHILEPQVEYTTSYRAKGVNVKVEVEKPVQVKEVVDAPLKDKIKHSITMISTNAVKLAPALKFIIAHAQGEDKEIYEECASVLEDILHSVQLKMKRVINRAPKAGAQEEKFEKKKEKEKMDEEARKAEDDKKRKLRQQQLLEELNAAKEQRQEKLKKEEERRQRDKMLEEQRKKEAEERIKREKEAKAKQILEWNNKREAEEKKKKEEEEAKKILDQENLKKFEEAKKRNQERLEGIFKEKQQKRIESKAVEEKKIKAENLLKEKKKQIGIERHKEIKQKIEKSDKTGKDALVLSNIEVKNMLNLYSQQIDCVYTFYLSLMGKDMPEDACLTWTVYEKFSNDFDIYSLIEQEQNSNIFKHFTKKKSNETLSFDDFKAVLAIIANKSKQSFGVEEPGKALEQLLIRLDLTKNVKAIKTKLKAAYKARSFSKNEERKKRVVSKSQANSKKILPPALELNPASPIEPHGSNLLSLADKVIEDDNNLSKHSSDDSGVGLFGDE